MKIRFRLFKSASKKIYLNTSFGFLWHLRCVASTSSAVQMSSLVLQSKMQTKFKQLLMLVVLFLFANINTAYSQTINVQGVVKSSDGQPLSGASVIQKKGKAATTTNQDGLFSLKVNSGSVLVVSYVGYETQEIQAAASVEVSLVAQPSKLADVEIMVDKGYGKSKRIAVSSSISSVRGKDLQNQTGYNLGTLLQGKATEYILCSIEQFNIGNTFKLIFHYCPANLG